MDIFIHRSAKLINTFEASFLHYLVRQKIPLIYSYLAAVVSAKKWCVAQFGAAMHTSVSFACGADASVLRLTYPRPYPVQKAPQSAMILE